MESNNYKLDSVAVISMGSIGRRHVRIVRRVLPECRIFAVRSGRGVSCNEETLLSGLYSSVEEVIEGQVDAAIICAPASMHVEYALPFLEKNIPLLIEKPVADTTENAFPLLSAADGKIAYVGYVLRHHPAYKVIRDIIDNNELGAVRMASITVKTYLPNWRPEIDYRLSVSAQRNLGGGVLRELSHELDYAQSLLGNFAEVVGYRNEKSVLDIEVEEQVIGILTTEDKVHVQLSFDFASSIEEREFRIHFAEGEVIWNLLKQTLIVKRLDRELNNMDFSIGRDELFVRQFKTFIGAINGETTLAATIKESVMVLSVIEGLEKSFEKKKIVSII